MGRGWWNRSSSRAWEIPEREAGGSQVKNEDFQRPSQARQALPMLALVLLLKWTFPCEDVNGYVHRQGFSEERKVRRELCEKESKDGQRSKKWS